MNQPHKKNSLQKKLKDGAIKAQGAEEIGVSQTICSLLINVKRFSSRNKHPCIVFLWVMACKFCYHIAPWARHSQSTGPLSKKGAFRAARWNSKEMVQQHLQFHCETVLNMFELAVNLDFFTICMEELKKAYLYIETYLTSLKVFDVELINFSSNNRNSQFFHIFAKN